MFKLYFVCPNQKITSIPCESLEEAKEGRHHLPAGSYFCIEDPNGNVVDAAPEFAGAIQAIQLLKIAYSAGQRP